MSASLEPGSASASTLCLQNSALGPEVMCREHLLGKKKNKKLTEQITQKLFAILSASLANRMHHKCIIYFHKYGMLQLRRWGPLGKMLMGKQPPASPLRSPWAALGCKGGGRHPGTRDPTLPPARPHTWQVTSPPCLFRQILSGMLASLSVLPHPAHLRRLAF